MLMEIYNPKALLIIIIYFGKRDGPSYCRMSVFNAYRSKIATTIAG